MQFSNRGSKSISFLSIFICCLASFSSSAQFIDFEGLPGAVEGLEISTQYSGVTFALEDGTFPRLAMVGAPVKAFSPNDTPLPSANAGSWFLTDDDNVGIEPSPLIITFDAVTAAASGVILDIDSGSGPPEKFLVEAMNSLDQIIDYQEFVAGQPGTGDQLATVWSFNFATAVIKKIKITASRDDSTGNPLPVGLAFDNFDRSNAAPCDSGTPMDFETIPGGTPTSGLPISNQFVGVEFLLESTNNPTPVLAEVGAPETAFTPNDTPASGTDVGQFFLTDDNEVLGNPPPLRIEFSPPVAQAGGKIIDIDGFPGPAPEIFIIEALNAAGTEISSIVFNAELDDADPDIGNQQAKSWSFSQETAEIATIRITGFRANDANLGFALDLFSCRYEPESEGHEVPVLGVTGLLSLFFGFIAIMLFVRGKQDHIAS